jgi:hypothetical protein
VDQTHLGKERAIPTGDIHQSGLADFYDVTGTNLDGSDYGGKLEVITDGDV